MSVLVLVEHNDGVISEATLASITAALQLGDVHVLVAGHDVAAVAQAAAVVGGVSRVLLA
jgi:electron transfer flavoprotein alpha subunit